MEFTGIIWDIYHANMLKNQPYYLRDSVHYKGPETMTFYLPSAGPVSFFHFI